MNNTIDYPWHRYALITELAERFKEKNRPFGKTALQKMVYLLQELYKIDCGYRFSIYTYGPFTNELLSDLDFTEQLGGVLVSQVDPSFGSYRITPDTKSQVLRDKAGDFLAREDVKQALSLLLENFGHYCTKDLELRSTIVYIANELRILESSLTMDRLCSVTKGVKPRFSDEEIRNTAEELRTKSYIQLHP